MKRLGQHIRSFIAARDGSVAPTVALSLIGLIAAGGIAFDYARLVTMDSELQDAADQAALAAATQLTGAPETICDRATDAAMNFINNETRFASDTQGRDADPVRVEFFKDEATTIPATCDDEERDERFVRVIIETRSAYFAFTPIAKATGGKKFDLNAGAVAGLGSAVCRVPPFMMCSPTPGEAFDPADYVGKGIRLVLENGQNSYFPGGFGFLDVGADDNGSPDQWAAMSLNGVSLGCVDSEEAPVDTGNPPNVLLALNARFDIFGTNATKNCLAAGTCSPAMNVVKDLVRKDLATASSCGISNRPNNPNQKVEWYPPANPYRPNNIDGTDPDGVDHMGLPHDTCHYPTVMPVTDQCGRIGNGTWNRSRYFSSVHGFANWQDSTGLPANVSRYDVYRWELGIPGVGNGNGTLPTVGPTGFGERNYGAPQCAPGLPAGPSQPDRRVVSAAIVSNCDELSGGSTEAEIEDWIDIFLVEPVADRGISDPTKKDFTSTQDLYVEVIGRSLAAGDGENAQVIRREKPYLVR